MALLIDLKFPQWLSDDELRSELLGYYPEADMRIGDDPGNLDEIEMLTVSGYQPGEASRYPNLKLIQKTGAGVNNILADADLSPDIRVARLQTETSGAEMAEYALACVLQEQRHLRTYREQQVRSEWISYPPRRACETTVAVLGLGRIGIQVVQRFIDGGFQVSGWSRSLKELPNVACFAGEDGLHRVLKTADYVVSVLPSTGATRGMFNAGLFERLKSNACFINMGRGDLVDETDLIHALDRNLFATAVLDVMSTEPLPEDNPLWQHPKILLTPHISGYHLGDAIADIAENYRRLRNGEPLLNLIDRNLGY